MHRPASFALAVLLAQAASQAAAPPDPCKLLTPADVAPLLGSEKPPHSFGTQGPLFGCTWGGAGSGGKNNYALMITTSQMPPGKAASNFDLVEKNALAHPDRAQVEPDLGDKAFSEIASYGVRILALKSGRVLQLQFTTGKTGTADQLAALRAIAKKAVAAF